MVNEKTIYLATMPKSGTNMLHYFFHFYDAYLAQNVFDPLDSFKKKPAPYLELSHSKLGKFLIGHGYCSGFKDNYKGGKKNAWDSLMVNPGFIPLEESIHTLAEFVDPACNESVRIAFIYRNPLDQLVSMYSYVDMLDLIEENYQKDIDSYIKVLFTFMEMNKIFPDKIKLFTYEKMKSDKRQEILNMLTFFQHHVNDTRNHAFEKALFLTSKEEIQKMEKATGCLLVGNKMIGAENRTSHITDGKIGKWKDCQYITNEVITYLHHKFDEFDISRSDFIWE